MSSNKKSKKTTVTLDKSVQDISKVSTQKFNQQLNISSSKMMLKKLSMSFYAEDTLKKTKQVILDDYDYFEDFNNYSDVKSCKENATHNSNSKFLLKNKSTKQSINNETSTRFFKAGQTPNKIINQKHKSLSKQRKIVKRPIQNGSLDKNQKIQKLVNKLKKLKLNQGMEDSQISSSHFQHFDNYINPFQLTIQNRDAFPNQNNRILYRKQNKSTTPLRKSKTPYKNFEINLQQQQSKTAKRQNMNKLTVTPNRIKSTDKIVKNKQFINWFKVLDQKSAIKTKQSNFYQLSSKKKGFF